MSTFLTVISVLFSVLGWLLLAAILLLTILFLSKVKLVIKHSGKPEFSLKLWFFNFNITKFLSKNKKDKKIKAVKFTGESFGEFPESKMKQKKSEKKQLQSVKDAHKTKTAEKSKKTVSEILEMLKEILLDISEPFGKCAVLHIKKLHVTAASPDPEKTAVMFGNLNTAASGILLAAQKFNVLKVDDGAIGVYSDFLSEAPSADIHFQIDVKVKYTVITVLKALKSYMKNK